MFGTCRNSLPRRGWCFRQLASLLVQETAFGPPSCSIGSGTATTGGGATSNRLLRNIGVGAIAAAEAYLEDRWRHGTPQGWRKVVDERRRP